MSAEMIPEMARNMDRLRRRLFQLVEAVGLPDKQETAFKETIRSTTYDAQRDLESALRRGA